MLRFLLLLAFTPVWLDAGVIVLKNKKKIACHGPFEVKGSYLHYKDKEGNLYQLPVKIVDLEKSTMEDPKPKPDPDEVAAQKNRKKKELSLYEMAGHDKRASSAPSAKAITDSDVQDYARKRGRANSVSEDRTDPYTLANNTYYMVSAIRRKDLGEMKRLIARGAPIDGKAYDGRPTPLHMAIAVNSPKMVEALIDAGADIERPSAEGDSPLAMSVKRNLRSKKNDVPMLLIKAGADVNRIDAGKTAPIHYAVATGNAPLAEALLKYGATPHLRHPVQGEEPLIISLGKKDATMVKTLLDGGADPNAKTKQGAPALSAALGLGSMNSMKLLLDAGANINAADNEGHTPLIMAVSAGSAAMTMLLLENKADPNIGSRDGKPLDLAVVGGYFDVAEYLIAKGAEVDDPQGLLDLAVQKNQPTLAMLLIKERKAKVNSKNSAGDPPLVTAARNGNLAMVSLLLDQGADPSLKGHNGYSAYLEAAGPRKDAIKALIQEKLEQR